MRLRKIGAAFAAALAILAATAGSAAADPTFGPGNGSQVGNQKCHPPGQTVDEPGCK